MEARRTTAIKIIDKPKRICRWLERNVDVESVIKVLKGNASKAKNVIKELVLCYEKYIEPNDPATNCLDVAIITDPKKRSKKTLKKLKNVAGRVLKK